MRCVQRRGDNPPMCLIAIAWQAHPRYPLIVAANRDEWRYRASAPLARWPDSAIIAPRDLVAGGTWIAVSRDGRFAAVTNVRNAHAHDPTRRSRGALVTGFVLGSETPIAAALRVGGSAADYAPFNLVLGDHEALLAINSRERVPRRLAPGVHALSNGGLDADWPKTRHARAGMSAALSQLDPEPALWQLLADRAQPDDAALPDTGVGLDIERRLAPAFIDIDGYGTRSSTLVLRDAGGGRIVERCFDPASSGETRIDWQQRVSGAPSRTAVQASALSNEIECRK